MSVFLVHCTKRCKRLDFKRLDTDKNGKISKDEWMAKFNAIDFDESGSVTKEEMKKYKKARKKKNKN